MGTGPAISPRSVMVESLEFAAAARLTRGKPDRGAEESQPRIAAFGECRRFRTLDSTAVGVKMCKELLWACSAAVN
jgi:hypothetical protein